MTITLPPSIAAYYAAEAADDPEALARAFTPEGTVKDEGETHSGRPAIAAWTAAAKAKYRHRSEVIGMAERDGKHVVSVRVSGDFPGSPATLENRFRLDGNAIRSLEIG